MSRNRTPEAQPDNVQEEGMFRRICCRRQGLSGARIRQADYEVRRGLLPGGARFE